MSEEFRVLVPLLSDNLTYRTIHSTEDRSIPEIRDKILDDELREWLDERNIVYSLGFHEGAVENTCLKYYYNYFIVFNNKNDAMLFKLTWG
jgi:hypothetical protein